MTIALAILHADPARGGAERYTVDLAAALRDRGHAVTLVTVSPPPEIDRVESIVLPFSGPTRLGRYVRYIDALENLRRTRSFDVLHAMLPVHACDIYHPHAGLAAEAVTLGHLTKSTPLQKAMSKMANRFNAKRQRFAAVERTLLMSPKPPIVLGLSDYVNAAIRRQYPGLPPDRLRKLFNAVDLQRFDPSARPQEGVDLRRRLGIPDDAVVGVMLAQDFARKGLSETIAAIAEVGDPRLHLLVAGRQDPGPYRHAAQSLGIIEKLHTPGATDNPYAFYAAAQFYILPTRHDPCSLGTLESLAMGVPVISTVYNGACEAMTDGLHGIVLSDPSDITDIARAVKGMLDPTARAQMRSACLLLRPQLSYAAHVEHLLGMYDAVRAIDTGLVGES